MGRWSAGLWCLRGGGAPGMGRRSRWFRVGSQVGRGQSPHAAVCCIENMCPFVSCLGSRNLLRNAQTRGQVVWGIIRGGGGAALQGVEGSDEPAQAKLPERGRGIAQARVPLQRVRR